MIFAARGAGLLRPAHTGISANTSVCLLLRRGNDANGAAHSGRGDSAAGDRVFVCTAQEGPLRLPNGKNCRCGIRWNGNFLMENP